MTVRRSVILLTLFMMTTTILFAQGTTVYDFLLNDVGARAAALGGSFVTSTDDPNLIFYNPAGLATLSTTRFSVGFFKHLLDINAGYASFGTEIPHFGFVGAGINYINYGEFQRTDDVGNNLGTFGAGELAVSVGYAAELQPGLTYGLNTKYIYSSIAEVHSSTVAVDLGTQYVVVPDRFLIGASVLNLGTQLNPYVTTREDLPLDITIGASVYPEHLPAAIMVNLHKLNQSQDSFGKHFTPFSVGVEFTASPNVQVRVGYNNEQHQDMEINSSAGLAGFSIGMGIDFGTYKFDYAFTSFGNIGGVHRISVAL